MPKTKSPLEHIYQPVKKVETSEILPGYLTNSDSSHAIVVETHNGPKIVNFCSEDYTLIPNRKLFEPLLATLKEEYNVQVRAHQYKDSRYFVDFIIKDTPNYISKKDEVFPKIRFQNSYDGKLKLSLVGGVWRVICSNGAGAFQTSKRQVIMHTSSIADGVYLQKTQNFLHEFLADQEKVMKPFKEMAAETVLNLEKEVEDVLDSTDFPRRWKEPVIGRFIEETKTLGLPPSRFVLYNAFNFQLNHNRELAMEENKRDVLDEEVFEVIYNY